MLQTVLIRVGRIALAAAGCLWMSSGAIDAQQAPGGKASSHALEIADVFSRMGDQIYEECIFDLSDEQLSVQDALIKSYIAKGATSATARKLAASQIQPPKVSEDCERVRSTPQTPARPDWSTTTEQSQKKAPVESKPKAKPSVVAKPQPLVSPRAKQLPPQWDCAPNVDYVVVHIDGYERKLTGGEICNPFQDVVYQVPASVERFRLGYTIVTGRLFVISDDPQANGKTIAWGISGRFTCRNNPDPDCLAARSIGPLPPGEYSFSNNPSYRVSWGPRTKRNVAGVYLKTLWNTERFSAAHAAAIRKRGNIAIHVRLKGEMSEACIGLEPKGWAYVASLIKAGRATGLNVYIDEPHPKIAEKPPLITGSSFSLTSLFSN